MRLTFLGTGTSTGVPAIGCECETCTSDDPRDKRLRVSVLVEQAGRAILVDTSTDFRQQALRHRINRLDAVVITHSHADHIFGLDDLRPINFRHGALPLFTDERAWRDLRRIFRYVFEPTWQGGGLPQIVPHTIEAGVPFSFAPDFRVLPLEVSHGGLPILAFRFNDFAYVTDVSEMSQATTDALANLDVLVLDCLRFKKHPTHFNLEESLAIIERLRPRRTYLTHIAHDIKHARDSHLLPPGVEWAYDGLEVNDER